MVDLIRRGYELSNLINKGWKSTALILEVNMGRPKYLTGNFFSSTFRIESTWALSLSSVLEKKMLLIHASIYVMSYFKWALHVIYVLKIFYTSFIYNGEFSGDSHL